MGKPLRIADNPTTTPPSVKPRKPYPSFPLSPHATGRWYKVKKIGGRKRFFYFGTSWEDWRGALKDYLAAAEQIENRQMPLRRADPDGALAGELYELWLEHCQDRVKSGEIGVREFYDLRRAADFFLDVVGDKCLVRGLDDPNNPVTLWTVRKHIAARVGVYALNRNLTKIRSMLKWGRKSIGAALHDHEALAKPKARVVRRARRERDERLGKPLFTPPELLHVVYGAVDRLPPRAALLSQTLLALNAGIGPSHISDLPLHAVNLDTGFVDWVRPKTEEFCKFWLWPITRAAILDYLPHRPMAKATEHSGLLFITKYGHPFVQEYVSYDEEGVLDKINPDDAIGKEFRKLLDALDADRAGEPKLRRPGRLFYALKHTHITAANSHLDKDARRLVNGHSFTGMDPHYVRDFDPARLRAVTDHVGALLLPALYAEHAVPRRGAAPRALPSPRP